ncbi:uncharacterized protein LOC131659635 [Vicia villosa]|uniref:uncharacterized protein LOC131659635 n=1 Tax=Vicia villosa TaxID=3911 RepID=UPI00273CA8E9|nr:uncharacterized protein LOC131659635 [Vicia villosa]
MGLKYTPPTIVNGEIEVVIEEQDIKSEMEFWENALIMYEIGEGLTMNAVKRFMMNTWNFVTLPDLYYHDEGYFLIRFRTRKDRDDVLKGGPYSVYKKPVLLFEWSPNFNVKEDILRVIPIWVIFPQLPLNLWGDESIGKISSAIGKPVMTDECIARKLRILYARVLIEVDVTRELKSEITVWNPAGGKQIQQVHYEWKPQFCTKCNKVGHMCKEREEIVKKPDETKRSWQNTDKEEWVSVAHGTKGKTPRAGLKAPEVEVACNNGFTALKIGTCFEDGGTGVP